MNISIIIYFLLFTLALGFLFYHVPGYLKTKVLMVCAMFYMSSAIIFSFDSYMGWPTDDDNAPDTMLLTSVVIFDKTTKSDGMIYVTGIPCSGTKDVAECLKPEKNESIMAKLNPMKVFGYAPPEVNTPRIFIFPYTDKNRKAFAEAQSNMSEGGQSFFRRKGKKGSKSGDGEGMEGEEGEGQGGGKAQQGQGTLNAQYEGDEGIYIDNRSLDAVLRKEDTK